MISSGEIFWSLAIIFACYIPIAGMLDFCSRKGNRWLLLVCIPISFFFIRFGWTFVVELMESEWVF